MKRLDDWIWIGFQVASVSTVILLAAFALWMVLTNLESCL